MFNNPYFIIIVALALFFILTYLGTGGQFFRLPRFSLLSDNLAIQKTILNRLNKAKFKICIFAQSENKFQSEEIFTALKKRLNEVATKNSRDRLIIKILFNPCALKGKDIIEYSLRDPFPNNLEIKIIKKEVLTNAILF
jgi:hypothetical protein